jgi:S1-C subfamily serine protease
MFRSFVLASLAVSSAPFLIFGQAPRLIRSLSGPSGTVNGSTFVFGETRTRFVFPQDKSLTVYFEFEVAPGNHVLTAIWKDPSGRAAVISPDVRMQTATKSLNCYWVFNLTQGLPDGVWTLEVRMDGQPAGSHVFELAGLAPAPPPPELPAAPVVSPPKQVTLDDIFKSTSTSMVWIHKLDGGGRRFDTSSGYVFQVNRIATAFQSIDGAAQVEVEFANRRKSAVHDLVAFSRMGDWAILPTDTGSTPPIPSGDPKAVAIGERLIVFNVESGARVIGGTDIAGRETLPVFGDRIHISPAVTIESVGGPLLDLQGRVVGILGGSTAQGSRVSGRALNVSPALWQAFHNQNSVTPISALPTKSADGAKSFDALLADGTLTVPIDPMQEFAYGSATNTLPKNPIDPLPREVSEFSKKDAQVWIFTMWSRKGKLSKGEISSRVYDPSNHVVVTTAPKKVTLQEAPIRVSFSFSPASLPPGIYRIDVAWDERPVWRTFIRISD